jgi:hypothetical protein
MLDLLSGLRVVSFNHFLLGPMGIQALADLGADVIAVESTDGAWQRHWAGGDIWPDGHSALFLAANRNKRSLALDLKSASGREIALKLVDSADVVAENFRPGVMEKLGLGYERLKARKPSLIYASASGYGPMGLVGKPGRPAGAGAVRHDGHHRPRATGPRPAGASVIDHHGAALLAINVCPPSCASSTRQGCQVDAADAVGPRPAGGSLWPGSTRQRAAVSLQPRGRLVPAAPTGLPWDGVALCCPPSASCQATGRSRSRPSPARTAGAADRSPPHADVRDGDDPRWWRRSAQDRARAGRAMPRSPPTLVVHMKSWYDCGHG